MADDGDAAGVAEGEDAVVFEEDDGAAGCGAGEGLVGGAVDGVGVDAAEGFGVEFAEADADRQDVGGCAVEVFFGDEAAVEGVAEVGESGFGAVVVLGEAVDSVAEGVRVGGGVVVVVVLGVDEVAAGAMASLTTMSSSGAAARRTSWMRGRRWAGRPLTRL